MDGLDEKIPDWVNLPLGTEPVSLWCSVHDASLLSASSDLLARTLTLHFDTYYLRSFHNLGEGITFSILLKGVQSVRAFRWSVWPGNFPLPPAKQWEEHQTKMAEFRKLWRQESESWETFQSSVNGDEDAEITEGEVVSGDGISTIRLGVQMGTGEWYEVFVRAEGLAILRSDQQEIALSEFLSLGHAYWKAFDNRSKKNEA